MGTLLDEGGRVGVGTGTDGQEGPSTPFRAATSVAAALVPSTEMARPPGATRPLLHASSPLRAGPGRGARHGGSPSLLPGLFGLLPRDLGHPRGAAFRGLLCSPSGGAVEGTGAAGPA